MSGLFGAAASAPANSDGAPKYTGLGLQTSAYGLPKPIVYGLTRVGCNILWYQNFRFVTVTQPAPSAGKGGITGGGGGKGGQTGPSTTTYYVDIILGICEGPISGVPSMWASQTRMSPATQNLEIFSGAYGQAVWPYLASNYPSQALAYSGTAYAAGPSYPLGQSNQLPNNNFEVEGVLFASSPNGADCDPSLVVSDYLTNSHYGAGFPAARLGELKTAFESYSIPSSAPFTIQVVQHATFAQNLCVVRPDGTLFTCKPVGSALATNEYTFDGTTGIYTFSSIDNGDSIIIRYAYNIGLLTFQQFVNASSLWISPAYTSQNQASADMQDIATACFSDFVWSAGFLKLLPRSAVDVSGNGWTYSAVTEPLFSFDDDDLLPNSNAIGSVASSSTDDPIILTRHRKSDQINSMKIECLDRNNNYATAVVEVQDQALIDKYGLRTNGSTSLHIFADIGAANRSAQLQLQDQNILNQYSLALDMRFCTLDPGDIISVTDTLAGIDGQWVRIREIQENEDGTFAFSCEEYPFGHGSTAQYDLNPGQGTKQDYNEAPGPVNDPIITAAPIPLAGNQGLMMWAAVSGSNPSLYGGCHVWVASQPTGPFKQVGYMTGASRMGVLTADFPPGADPDKVHSLAVDVTESNAQLSSGTQADADQGNTACLLHGVNGDEIVSYETATLVGTGIYNLGTYIRRGQYDTQIIDSPAGTKFTRIDINAANGGLFAIPYQASQINTTLYVKFTAFNIFGGGEEDISEVTTYSVAIPSPPPPPAVKNFTAASVGDVVVFEWSDVNYPMVALAGYYIGYAPQGTTDWSQFRILTLATAGTEMTNANVPRGLWTFGIRAASIANVPGTDTGLSPTITTADLNVTNTQPVVYNTDEAPAWAGTIN